MKHRFRLSRTLLLFALVAWLAACASSPPVRYYTLTPMAPETKQSSGNGARPVSISVMPVEIPGYLDRPHIVTLDGRNRLKLAEFDRWAGSLSDSMSEVLAENLALLLRSDKVFVDSGRLENAEYSVAMRVLRLDCLPGDHVLLKAQWTVSTGPENKNVSTHTSDITRRLNDNRYDTIAAAVSQTLEQVSREIANQIPAK